MIIKGGMIFGEDLQFHEENAVIRNGRFAETGKGGVFTFSREDADEETVDASGMYVIPGLLDIHFHGALGDDISDGNEKAYETAARFELTRGVTQICPATLTLSVEDLKNVLRLGADFADRQKEHTAEAVKTSQTTGSGDRASRLMAEAGADLVGINMEGPFISHAKKGAQNENYILPCSAEIAEQFLEASRGLVKVIGLAPEEEGNRENFEKYIAAVKEKVHVSLAHTAADYDTAMRAFAAGACHGVHLYNAMTELTHRAPGVVGAIMDSPHVTAEIICDGVHVHPAAVRAAFREMGASRMILISDSLRCTGMEDGTYMIGGQQMEKRGPYCRLTESGTIAGSVSSLMDCMVNAVKTMDIPLETAVASATINPARRIGVDAEYGSIAPGKHGNAVLLDRNLDLRCVIKDGVTVIRR